MERGFGEGQFFELFSTALAEFDPLLSFFTKHPVLNMPTHAQNLCRVVREATSSAERIASVDHSCEALFPSLQTIGSTLERFLKGHAFPEHNGNLFDLIEKAKASGLSPSAESTLQEFRKDFYNKSKHQEDFSPSTGEILRLLQRLNHAIHELAGLGLGQSEGVAPTSSRRLFWLGFWDHYIGGDTEVLIALPTVGTWTPPAIDTIYVDIDAWNSLKIELPQIGTFSKERGSIPQDVYEAWSREGDFLAAGSFEGSYSSLIQVLASHERVENLLPHLKRENQTNSMLSASAFATVQAARTGLLTHDNRDDIQNEIFIIAEATYAAPRNSPLVRRYIAALGDAIVDIPPSYRISIQGPTWVTLEEFDREISLGAKLVADLKVALTLDFRIILGLRI